MKKISKYIAFIGALSLFPSCKDYLKEELVSTVSYDYYENEKGMEELVNAGYNSLRWHFNGEQSFTLHEYGVDEYTQASDGQNKQFDSYTTELNPVDKSGILHGMWTEYYRAINICNLGIQKIPTITGVSTILKDEAGKQQRIAELRFLRAFYYFNLVQQFGAIPLVLEGAVSVRLEFARSPVADVYKQIFADFRFAESILPENQTQYGRITKGAARHYLAKAYLTRGSAVTEARGQQATDMDSSAYWAEQVINQVGYKYQLQDNFADLWKIDNQNNKEIIFAAQFVTNTFLINESANRTHLYFLMNYDPKSGMQRDIPNGRAFRRIMPTDYTFDVFDRKNDSRFYKSFKMTFFSNNAANLPKWTDKDAPNPGLVGKAKFNVGDTAVYLTLTPNVSDADISKRPYSWIPRNKFNKQDFPTLVKYIDPLRADISTEFGTRDGIYARLAETYLIAAEAYGRNGSYGKAVEYINVLRRRAAYKAGEQKHKEHWTVEGGLLNDMSSTEANLLVTEASFDAAEPREQYPASAVSTKDRFIHFMLNERTRELVGEFHRWNDLARTETLVERVKKFNPASTTVQAFHKLRPIPQQHLERVYQSGRQLTAEERQAQQNPGY